MKIIRIKKSIADIVLFLKKFEGSQLENNKSFWKLWLKLGYAVNIFFGAGFFVFPILGYEASLLPYALGILCGIHICNEAHEKIRKIEAREENEALERRRAQYKDKS